VTRRKSVRIKGFGILVNVREMVGGSGGNADVMSSRNFDSLVIKIVDNLTIKRR